ncbi:MAG: hypothetical protein KA419_07265 [Acidobacteria bacterium]|nr:hypothetical protein [Acidobacteriota bacterium]
MKRWHQLLERARKRRDALRNFSLRQLWGLWFLAALLLLWLAMKRGCGYRL